MKRFERVYIEISDYCGLACGFCPSARRKSMRGEMDLELFRRICAEVRGIARRVCLHLLGDPLSVDSLNAYLRVAGEFGLKVEIVSSGLFLSKHSFESLISAPIVQICFSLSAMIANSARFSSSHLARILSFCDYALQSKSEIFINLRLQNVYIESSALDSIIGAIAKHFKYDIKSLKTALKNGEKVRLARKILLLSKRQFQWQITQNTQYSNKSADSKIFTNTDSIKRAGRFCLALQKQIGILSNGILVPCCMDYAGEARLGNLNENSLRDLLESSTFQRFESALSSGIPAHRICQDCGFHQA